MRKGFLWIAALLLLALPVWLQAKELEAATSQAGVSAVDKTVQKLPRGQSAWQACQVGDVLTPGDRIKTGAESSATLLLCDKTMLRLAQNTEILIVDLTENETGLVRRFQLSLGRVWSDVTPNPEKPTTYEVKGPNAVAAVKGTAFEVDAEGADGGTDVTCFRGEVECTVLDGGGGGSGATQLPPPGPVRISADGEFNQFQARLGKAPQRRRFSQDQIDAFQRWNLDTWAKLKPELDKLPRRIQFDKNTFQKFRRWHTAPPARQRQRLKTLRSQREANPGADRPRPRVRPSPGRRNTP